MRSAQSEAPWLRRSKAMTWRCAARRWAIESQLRAEPNRPCRIARTGWSSCLSAPYSAAANRIVMPVSSPRRLCCGHPNQEPAMPPPNSEPATELDEQLSRSALDYHRLPTPGKISILPTKGLSNQRDLALAYSPGVAAACMEIVRDPAEADKLTA